MSAEELYEDPVWWRSEELLEYCEEAYGEDRGREVYDELMSQLDEAEMPDGYRGATAVAWGHEDEPIIGQMELDNHLIYRVEDRESLIQEVYDGGMEAFREEAAIDNSD